MINQFARSDLALWERASRCGATTVRPAGRTIP